MLFYEFLKEWPRDRSFSGLLKMLSAGAGCRAAVTGLDGSSLSLIHIFQREYYLPDILTLMREQGHRTGACRIEEWQVALGINDRRQLAVAAAIMRERINRSLMLQGVTMVDPSSTYIDFDVQIGPDTVIWPQTVIEGLSLIHI